MVYVELHDQVFVYFALIIFTSPIFKRDRQGLITTIYLVHLVILVVRVDYRLLIVGEVTTVDLIIHHYADHEDKGDCQHDGANSSLDRGKCWITLVAERHWDAKDIAATQEIFQIIH